MHYICLFFFFFIGFWAPCHAQKINGVVADRENKSAVANVQLVNIYNHQMALTDSIGQFSIAADKGELIEVRAAGYRSINFRISKGQVPTYFKIYLDKIVLFDTNRFAHSDLTAFQIDSIKSRELYSETLNYPRMSTFEQIESPFTALSKSNQMKWHFQDQYAQLEQEKFIDFTFNDTLITKITGLVGDELAIYKKRFRPSYQSIRSMSTYDFYTYIRITGERFKKSKLVTPRNSG